MVKEKKTALDVLIDFFVEYSKDNVKPKNCAIAQYCGECWHGEDCSKCKEQLREYAKEQATIPDGWEVIQEIYKVLCNCINLCREEGEDDQYFEPVWRFIYEQLKKAGKEIEND